MTWSAEWSKKASRDLDKIASVDVERILEKTDRVLENPISHLTKITNSWLYKYRVGDYRITVHVVHDRQVLLVTRVRKRSRAYA